MIYSSTQIRNHNITTKLCKFYVHVTVHRNKFIFNKTNRRTNFPNLFCQETLRVSGSSSAHHQEFSTVIRHWYMSCRLDNSFQARSSWPCLKAVIKSAWHTNAECTVENSWWWAEELPETRRASWQNKFGKLVRLLVLLKRKYTILFKIHSQCTSTVVLKYVTTNRGVQIVTLFVNSKNITRVHASQITSI